MSPAARPLLARARVLIVGAGGLGAPALLALGARGATRVRVLDPDRVEPGNLHRQLLYTEADVGRPKVEVAAERLARRFPGLAVEARVGAFEAGDLSPLGGVDLVLDGTDRFETKLALQDACVDAGLPYVFAGVVGVEGQVLAVDPGRSACVRCLFDEAPPPGAAPTCAEAGILGPVAGIVAARQVDAAASLLAGAADATDRLWVYDGHRDRAREVRLARAADCKGCGDRRAERGWLLAPPADEAGEAPTLDLTGLACPDTFVRTRRRLEALEPGARLWVVLTSDESARGVPASAVAAGHRLLARRSDGRAHRVLLERGPAGEG